MNPLVSVVMPAYNTETHITAALASIFQHQTQPLQVIVVNDGSTDATGARAAAFGERVTVLHQPNQGIFSALNRGIQAARGEWLTFLDADDLWMPERLEKQFAAFDAQPMLSSVYGQLQNFYSPETDATYRAQITCDPNPMPGLWQHTLLMRRADFLRVGLFETQWKLGAFIEWFERANELGMTYCVLPDVLLMRRLHPNNTGLREVAYRQDYARILKIVLDRKRRKNNIAQSPISNRQHK